MYEYMWSWWADLHQKCFKIHQNLDNSYPNNSEFSLTRIESSFLAYVENRGRLHVAYSFLLILWWKQVCFIFFVIICFRFSNDSIRNVSCYWTDLPWRKKSSVSRPVDRSINLPVFWMEINGDNLRTGQSVSQSVNHLLSRLNIISQSVSQSTNQPTNKQIN